MEANEALRRVVWRHRWLLVVLALVSVLVIVPMRERLPIKYAAMARIQAQSTPPDTSAQVQAIVSRVSAVATNPSLVRTAIASAKVHRNAVQVARHSVSVSSLGSSAVVVLTVTDTSKPVAIAIATSLASAVAGDLDGLGVQQSQALAALNATGRQLNQTEAGLEKALASAAARGEQSTNAEVQSLVAQLDAVGQQLSNNSAAADQVLASQSSATSAAVISTPSYATEVSREVAVYGGLAVLLGLVLGLLVATMRELLRPTVAEPATAARDLGTVLLGSAGRRKGQVVGVDDDLAATILLAGRRLRARTLALSGPVPLEQLRALAGLLATTGPAGEERASGVPDAWAARCAGPDAFGHSPDLDIAFAAPAVVPLADLRADAHAQPSALVAVIPPYARVEGVDRIRDLATTSGWPSAGVIALRRWPRRRAGHQPGDGPAVAEGGAATAGEPPERPELRLAGVREADGWPDRAEEA